MLPFLISGYPDLQPWMVRKSAYSGALGSSESQKNYYEYLSTLLDPMYGYENARSDLELVREWCILSVSSEAPDYRANFYSVAKETSKVFNRDLPLLLDLSMKIKDYELCLALGALNISLYLALFLNLKILLKQRLFIHLFRYNLISAAELLSDPLSCVDSSKVNIALNHMRQMIEFALTSDVVDSTLLSKVFKCFNLLLGKCEKAAATNFTELSHELEFAIALCKEDAGKLDAVIEVAVNVFPPVKALEMIQLCNPRRSDILLRSLRTILTRSARDEYQSGVSGSLLRVRRAHQALTKKPMSTTASNANIGKNFDGEQKAPCERRRLPDNSSEEIARRHADPTIWYDVLEGVAIIEK